MKGNTTSTIDTLKEFFHHLYLDLYPTGSAPEFNDRFLELLALRKGGHPCQLFIKDLDELHIFVEQNRQSNLFFGVALRLDNTSGSLENCADLPALFVDIDCKEVSQSETFDRLSALDFPPSCIVNSGGGWHAYWFLKRPLNVQDPADRTKARDLLRRLALLVGGDMACAEPSRRLRHPGTNNYKYVPPREVTIDLLETTRRYGAEELDAWLPPEPVGGTDAKGNGAGTTFTAEIPEGKRNETLYRLARSLKARGLGEEESLPTLREVNARRCRPPLDDREVVEIARNASTQADREDFAHHDGAEPETVGQRIARVVNDLNAKHAVVMVGGKCVILTEGIDPSTGYKDYSLSTPRDLRTLYENQMIFLGEKKPVNPITVWLRSNIRRTFDRLTFAPTRDVPGAYNLWRGFAVEPKEGNCGRYLDHLYWNICRGNQEYFDYLVGWMAHALQHPDDRAGVAIALSGPQGVGKGFAVKEFGALVGPHYIHIQHSRHLLGHFNAHLADKLIALVDEAFWAGDKQGEGVLKAMITEERLPIELKGKDVFSVPNHLHLFIASNHGWIIPAGMDDRRFFVLDVGDRRKEDHTYFAELDKEMKGGGREALLYLLLHRDLSGINLRRVPQTDALMENKLRTMLPAEKFWYEKLMAGSQEGHRYKWENWVIRDNLHSEYVTFTNQTGQRARATQTELGLVLRRLVPGIGKGERSVDKKRTGVWIFPPLAECRAHFDRLTKFKHSWPEESYRTINDSQRK